MTSNTPSPAPTTLCAVAPPALSVDEVAAWLDEIEPIASAARRDQPGGSRSPGLVEWASRQATIAALAGQWVEARTEEAEALDQPVEDLIWLCTRVQTVAATVAALLPTGQSAA